MAVTKLQLMLNDLLLKHNASLLLFDEICDLFNRYLSSPHFDQFAKPKSRKSLLRSTEKSYHSASLRPSNGKLHDNKLVTVPVFDAKQMILSLLLDSSLVNKNDIAEVYDVWTGLVMGNIPANDKYGEVHTRDNWLPAQNRYCQQENEMPVALIVHMTVIGHGLLAGTIPR